MAEPNLAEKRVWSKGMRHLKKRDPTLAKIISRLGPYEFRLDDDHYETLVGSIIFQQLAGAAARATMARFHGLANTSTQKSNICARADYPLRRSDTYEIYPRESRRAS